VTKLSAVLITANEERRLPDALASVAFCDEIVVVDAGSRDRTRAIAEAAGARVIENVPWPGFVAQRNLAVRAARYDWILAVDADERVTPALRAEIEALRAAGFREVGYRIPRVAYYLGRTVRVTDWYPDPQLRLFDRRCAEWRGAAVHESVHVDGRVGRLRAELDHHPYADLSDHVRRIDRYTTLWAEGAHAAGRRTNLGEVLLASAWAFARNLVLKRGFMLGGVGLTISMLNAFYTYAKLAKLRERLAAA
jgi:glycosyltransferase involved in cell wall biosynthesis